MNTREMARLTWDETELQQVVAAYVRRHRRLPSQEDLEFFRACEGFRATADLPRTG